jgi:CheY-like chemotaxis protein
MRWADGTNIPAVLIVEDEPLVRMGAVKIIEDAGFDVIEAASADEAIRILECRSDIRVVFTDIHMPGSMDGLKLAHAVRNRWPPIKIIVTSGRDLITEQDLPEGGLSLLSPTTQLRLQTHYVSGHWDGIGLSLVARLADQLAGALGPRAKESGQFYTDSFSK